MDNHAHPWALHLQEKMAAIHHCGTWMEEGRDDEARLRLGDGQPNQLFCQSPSWRGSHFSSSTQFVCAACTQPIVSWKHLLVNGKWVWDPLGYEFWGACGKNVQG